MSNYARHEDGGKDGGALSSFAGNISSLFFPPPWHWHGKLHLNLMERCLLFGIQVLHLWELFHCSIVHFWPVGWEIFREKEENSTPFAGRCRIYSSLCCPFTFLVCDWYCMHMLVLFIVYWALELLCCFAWYSNVCGYNKNIRWHSFRSSHPGGILSLIYFFQNFFLCMCSVHSFWSVPVVTMYNVFFLFL